MAAAATLVSTVDRNEIGLNETLALNVVLDQQIDTAALALNELESDFEILGVSPRSNSSVSIVNSQSTRTSSTQWRISLAPKREGLLTIPVFELQGAKSQAISIKVRESSGAGKPEDQPLSVAVTTSSDVLYPGQQLLVTIEISAQNNVSNLNGASLTIENADVETLEQNSFSRVDNGVARQIVVLKFAVFARNAGEIEIPAMTYTGLQNAQRDFFRTRGTQVVARSKPIKLSVKERAISSHTWFPAEDVTLRSEWSADTSKLQAGTPVTRTIVVTAKGQRAESIPPLDFDKSGSGYKTYQDKPQLHTETTVGGLVATRIESEAIVASATGEIVLPEVRLKWWNVITQRWQDAVLPAETLIAESGDALYGETQASEEQSLAASDNGTSEGANPTAKTWIWQAISLVLLAICVLQFWLLNRAHPQNESDQIQIQRLAAKESEKTAWKNLQSTLLKNDAQAIRKQLLNWIKAAFPDNRVTTISSLAGVGAPQDLIAASQTLEQHLYGSDSSLNVSQLKQSLTQFRNTLQNNPTTNNKETSLRPLYPTKSS